MPEPPALVYEVSSCSWGHVLWAATDAGVCAVLPGEEAKSLERDFLSRFPWAQKTNVRWSLPVGCLWEGTFPATPIPLDFLGTTFQKRVWSALCDIPRGETRSYRELARTMGQPGAARAVAQACAANMIAVLVPCHRVIAAKGALGGYRWGPERKAHLLRLEKDAAPSSQSPQPSNGPGFWGHLKVTPIQRRAAQWRAPTIA